MSRSDTQQKSLSLRFKIIGLSMALLSGSLSCGSNSSNDDGINPNIDPKLTKSVIENYSAIVDASYQDSILGATELKNAIDDFLDSPTQETFDQAKTAWLDSRLPYGQTEVYRFYSGPIDNDQDGPEALINSWPLDESYIDYVFDGQTILPTGIINDSDIELSPVTIADLNTYDEEDTITTGYHAIEFLLWGQDFNDPPEASGQRPFTDYVLGNEGTGGNQDRRRNYLKIVGELLLEDLQQVENAWQSDKDNYRRDLLLVNRVEALRRIIVGVGSLAVGELSSQRIETALLTKSQEDEHSCFSDNTHVDIAMNFKGVENIYFGRYQRTDGTLIDGPGLEDLFASVDPELNDQMKADLATAKEAIDGIFNLGENGVHFDQQIKGDDNNPNRIRIRTAVDALQSFGGKLTQAAKELGVDINVDTNGE